MLNQVPVYQYVKLSLSAQVHNLDKQLFISSIWGFCT